MGFGWFGSGQVLGLDGFCNRVRPVSFVGSGYRGETCKPVALGYSWVTEVQCHA
jgi:hypothetical protein